VLSILGTLERPTRGEVRLDGRDVHALPETELAAFRNREIGFVFQDHFLLPQLSVLENVLAPTLVAAAKADYAAPARALLERVGLGDRLGAAPAGRAVGRRAAAHGARARARDAAARAAVRRAHRQPRRRLGARGGGPDPRAPPRGAERAGAGDAQRRARGPPPAAPPHARPAARARLMRLRTLVLRRPPHPPPTQ